MNNPKFLKTLRVYLAIIAACSGLGAHGMNDKAPTPPAAANKHPKQAPKGGDEDVATVWARIVELENREAQSKKQAEQTKQLLSQAEIARRQRAEATKSDRLHDRQVQKKQEISKPDQEKAQKDPTTLQLESDLAFAAKLENDGASLDQLKQLEADLAFAAKLEHDGQQQQEASSTASSAAPSSTCSNSTQDHSTDRLPTKEEAIDTMVTKHTTKAVPNFPDKPIPTDIPKTKDKIIVVPSLQQTVKEDVIEDITNYCGYYAIWNALCFSLSAGADHRLDRKQFSEKLRLMLNTVHDSRSATEPNFNSKNISGRYGLLSLDEIRKIIEGDCSRVIVLELQSIFTPCLLKMQQDEALRDTDPNAYALILAFVEKNIDDISIILTTSANSGHYLAVSAKRKDGNLLMYVADSLSGTAQNHDILMDRIMPVYYLLTGHNERPQRI